MVATKKRRAVKSRTAVNISVATHKEFVAFCESKKPYPWPISDTADAAVREYMARNTFSEQTHRHV